MGQAFPRSLLHRYSHISYEEELNHTTPKKEGSLLQRGCRERDKEKEGAMRVKGRRDRENACGRVAALVPGFEIRDGLLSFLSTVT